MLALLLQLGWGLVRGLCFLFDLLMLASDIAGLFVELAGGVGRFFRGLWEFLFVPVPKAPLGGGKR